MNFSKVAVIHFYYIWLVIVSIIGTCNAEELNLYTSQPLSDIKVIVDKFEQSNNGIKINIYRSGTSEIILKLLVQEKAAAPKADIILLSDTVSMEYLKSKNLLAYIDFIELGLTSEQSKLCDVHQYYCGSKIIATGIAYSKKLKNPPKRWEDLLDKAYINKIVIADPAYSGAAAIQFSIFTHSDNSNLSSFYKNLTKQKVTIVPSNGQVLEYISKGFKEVGVIVDFMAIRALKNGADIDFIYPKEGVMIITEPVAILNSSKKKTEALQFLGYLLSEEIHDILTKQEYTTINKLNNLPYKILNFNPKNLFETYENDKKKFHDLFRENYN